MAVNTSDDTVRCTVETAERPVGEVFDAWTGEWLPQPDTEAGALRFELAFAPYQARVLLLNDPPAWLTAT